MSYLVWEMWRSPADEGGESSSSDARAWWEEECGGTFVQASAFRLPSGSARSVAVQKEHLQRKRRSWPHLAPHTKRDLVLHQCLLIKHLLAAALAGGCAAQRGLGGGSGGVHS